MPSLVRSFRKFNVPRWPGIRLDFPLPGNGTRVPPRERMSLPEIAANIKALEGDIDNTREKLSNLSRSLAEMRIPLFTHSQHQNRVAQIEALERSLQDAERDVAEARRQKELARVHCDHLFQTRQAATGVEETTARPVPTLANNTTARINTALHEYRHRCKEELSCTRIAASFAEALLGRKSALVDKLNDNSLRPWQVALQLFVFFALGDTALLALKAAPSQLGGAARDAAAHAKAVEDAIHGRDDMLCTFHHPMIVPVCMPASQHQAGLSDPGAVLADMRTSVNHRHYMPYPFVRARKSPDPWEKRRVRSSYEIQQSLDTMLERLDEVILLLTRGTGQHPTLKGIRAALQWDFGTSIPAVIAMADELMQTAAILDSALSEAQAIIEKGADDMAVAKLFVESSPIRTALSRQQKSHRIAVQVVRNALNAIPAIIMEQLQGVCAKNPWGILALNQESPACKLLDKVIDRLEVTKENLEYDVKWLETGVARHDRAAVMWESRRGKDWWVGLEVLQRSSSAAK